jgi:hypothetical protein
MARAQLTPVALGDTGYNLTDSAGFAVMSTGAGNGKEIVYDPATLVILKNTTGGAAVYTVKIPAPAAYTNVGSTVSDTTITVATNKTWLLAMKAVYRQADGDIYIDCDVAGSILAVY